MSAVADEGCMAEDEEEKDFSGSGEAERLRLEAVVYSHQPLPVFSRGKEEINVLIDQQKADVSLAEMRRMAEKCEDRHLWEDDVLVHIKLVDRGREWTRVVVLFCRRWEV